MLDQNVAREVLQEAVRTGGDFAEIFMEDRIDHAMGMRSHKLESATTSRTHGAGVRVFSGTNAIYVYTNDTSREGLMNCARQAAAGEFTKRAFLNGRMDLTQAEAVIDLIHAETALDAKNAAGQLGGAVLRHGTHL